MIAENLLRIRERGMAQSGDLLCRISRGTVLRF